MFRTAEQARAIYSPAHSRDKEAEAIYNPPVFTADLKQQKLSTDSLMSV